MPFLGSFWEALGSTFGKGPLGALGPLGPWGPLGPYGALEALGVGGMGEAANYTGRLGLGRVKQ